MHADSASPEELARCLRDVLGLLALPAIWRSKTPAEILISFSEALDAISDVDVLLAYTHDTGAGVRVARLLGRDAEPRGEELQQWFAPLVRASPSVQRVSCGELGDVTAVYEPLAYGGTQGHVVVGSQAHGFPSARQLVVIKTAAALATTALDTASALAEREAALRTKDEFLAVLGHELRNPLAPIATALDLMQLRQRGASSREEVIMRRQVEHLGRLVDDLLDVSKVSRGLLTIEKSIVELAPIVADAVEATAPLIAARRHSLSLSVPVRGLSIDADPVRLAQVVAHLLENAAKYTPPGGHVFVEASQRGSQVVLAVRDDGRGIDANLLPHVFEHFVQGRTLADPQYGGLGTGLSLVKTLVELHGGSVSVHSVGPGQGSELIVELPLAFAAGNEEGPRSIRPSSVPRPASPRRVLVLDDNVDAGAMLGEALTGYGYEVRVEHEPRSALHGFSDFRPEVALLDIGMPDLDGYQVAAEIRALGLEPAPLLIAVTGYGQPSDRKRSAAAGFAAHLVKPVDLGTLLELVASLTTLG